MGGLALASTGKYAQAVDELQERSLAHRVVPLAHPLRLHGGEPRGVEVRAAQRVQDLVQQQVLEVGRLCY